MTVTLIYGRDKEPELIFEGSIEALIKKHATSGIIRWENVTKLEQVEEYRYETEGR